MAHFPVAPDPQRKMKPADNLVVISDLHCGCQIGLCPSEGADRDSGGRYKPSTVQRKIWRHWLQFWDEWVPHITKGEPYDLVINGDLIDGRHHGTISQLSQNLTIQARIAERILKPRVDAVHAMGRRVFIIRGTEAHGGKSGEQEDALAYRLNAVHNEFGQWARYDLWIKVGQGLVNILHHIGTTGSSAYESTAVHKELVEAFQEAGRWKNRPPDMVVRSHRHRFFKTEVSAANSSATAVVTPGWQGKTPLTYRIAGARQSPPQFGGICIKQGEEGLYVRHKVWTIGRSKTV